MSDGEPIDPNQARHGHALAKGEKLRRDTIEVGELLGQGGFGMVYQAHTEGLISTQMVIKEYLPKGYARREHHTKSVLPISTSGDEKEVFTVGLKMFLKEAKILRKFDHKNIVRMDDYFEENNTAYMRLEYIKGETLADKLKREGRLNEQALKDILAGVLDGLAYVHEREHLHRDISPDNIMIREDGTPVLIDFGIARAKFGTAVRGSRMAYKKSYSPIEQRGQADGMDMKMEYGPGTDIYALSVVVYEALGGELPMDWIPRSARLGSGPDPMVPAVEALRGLAHENFLKAIDRGLQINLKDRPKSVADFRKMLFAEDVQEPDVQKPDDSPTRFDRGRGGFQKSPDEPKSSTEPRPRERSKTAIIGLVIALIALPALGLGYVQYRANDQISWQKARRANTIEAYEDYLTSFLLGSYQDQAMANIKNLEDKAAWQKAKSTNTITAYKDYIEAFPSGSYRDQAQADIKALQQQAEARRVGTRRRAAAERRAAEARKQSNLGDKYYYGEGVTKDYAKAVEWFLKAANQGYAYAQYSLGHMYKQGKGVAKDYAKAVEWYRKAAKQGNAHAQYDLGNMYREGEGVAKDYAKAVEWYSKAAKQGYADAHHSLGDMYYSGRGVAKDYAKAVEWYRKAAKQGNAHAQYHMGWMYYSGRGVAENRSIACDWWRKSAAQNDSIAKEALKDACS